jgi:DNA-directed RNA polymerase subunit RPC12/RpoP
MVVSAIPLIGVSVCVSCWRKEHPDISRRNPEITATEPAVCKECGQVQPIFLELKENGVSPID